MSDKKVAWNIRFGSQQSEGKTEYFYHVRELDGTAVDTSYSQDADLLFDELAGLLKSEATGIGFGSVPST